MRLETKGGEFLFLEERQLECLPSKEVISMHIRGHQGILNQGPLDTERQEKSRKFGKSYRIESSL